MDHRRAEKQRMDGHVSLVGFKARNHPQQIAVRGAVDRDDLGTDPLLFTRLNARFNFSIDVAASFRNAKSSHYFSVIDNGLAQEWTGERVWCNPPYSAISAWVEKAWSECGRAALIVMLLPANRTEQRWWQALVEPFRDRADSPLRVEFIANRQRFVAPGAEIIGPNERPPFGCCLLIWERNAAR